MLSVLVRSGPRWLLALVIAALLLMGGLGIRNSMFAPPPPIAASSASAAWTEDRTAITITTRDLTHIDECRAVRISRWLVLEDNYVLVPSTVVEGFLAGQVLPPRRVIATSPAKLGNQMQRVDIPDWIREQRLPVLGIAAEAVVTENITERDSDGQKVESPNCASRYRGTFRLYDVTFLPGNDMPAPLPRQERRSEDETARRLKAHLAARPPSW